MKVRLRSRRRSRKADQIPQMAKKLIEEEDDNESAASVDQNTDTASQDFSMDEDAPGEVNGVGHAK